MKPVDQDVVLMNLGARYGLSYGINEIKFFFFFFFFCFCFFFFVFFLTHSIVVVSL